jgi:ABC-type nitrate/sulfonate/bicarbonate transport system permease component
MLEKSLRGYILGILSGILLGILIGMVLGEIKYNGHKNYVEISKE